MILLITDEGSETSAQKGGREFMESEFTWMATEPKTEEPGKVAPATNTDTDKVDVKSARVGSEG